MGGSMENPGSPLEDEAVLKDVHALESATWAPWLAYTKDQLARHRQVFGPGQFEVWDDKHNLNGILSTNRINWAGNAGDLPTWDEVAGEAVTYEETYVPDGNTLALMSISVDPATRGKGVYRDLILQAQDLARISQIERLVGDFRPSGFGAYKRNTGFFDFEEYCRTTRSEAEPNYLNIKLPALKKDDQPQDPWLRAVKRLGMTELAADPRAMVVPASTEELDNYRETYKPEDWWKVTDPEQISYLLGWHQPHQDIESVEEIWECGETGTWYVDRTHGAAVYIESNLWGELPIRTERYDLTPEEIKDGEAKLIQKVQVAIRSKKTMQNVWLSSSNAASNLVRTWEASYFPEISSVVDDEVERHSAFLVTLENRQQPRIVHAARITGPHFAKEIMATNGERTYFAGIDELIAAGVFSAAEFYEYYKEQGIDTDNCIGVETNMRVGDKASRFNGLVPAQMAYGSFVRMLGAIQPDITKVGVFANINRASLISFRRAGFGYEPLLGKDLRVLNPNDQTDYYLPVFIPGSQNMEWFRDINRRMRKDIFLK